MKRVIIVLFCALIFLQGCAAEPLKDIIARDYPRIDGSTSSLPIVQEIYRAMFAPEIIDGEQVWADLPQSASQTIESYRMLIDSEVDLIIVPDPSEDVLNLADEKGVELELIPICLEALVFITHTSAPVDNLTTGQVKLFYSSEIINWHEISAESIAIFNTFAAFWRNADSGSHALLEKFVLKSSGVSPEIPEEYIIYSMFSILDTIENYVNENSDLSSIHPSVTEIPLGYSIYYFLQNNKESQNWNNIKILNIDGIEANNQTIASGEYPFATNYYAVIKKDTPSGAAARTLIKWLLTNEGQEIIEKSGFGKIN